MPYRQIFQGEVFTIYAAVDDAGRCEIEEFFTILEHNSPSDWRKLVSLAFQTANDEQQLNAEVCRAVGTAGLYEFLSAEARLIWFLTSSELVLCSSYLKSQGFVGRSAAVTRARAIQQEFQREGV